MRRAAPFLAIAAVFFVAVAAYAIAARSGDGSDTTAPRPLTTSSPGPSSTQRRPASIHLVSQQEIDRYPADSPQRALLTWWRASQFVDYQGFVEGLATRLRRKFPATAKTKRALVALAGFTTKSKVGFLGVRKRSTRAIVYTKIVYEAASPDGTVVTQPFPRAFRFVRQGGEWRLQNDDFVQELLPSPLRRA
jgi:hypothetical protein